MLTDYCSTQQYVNLPFAGFPGFSSTTFFPPSCVLTVEEASRLEAASTTLKNIPNTNSQLIKNTNHYLF